ncbi:MAG TPA: hypothetical protein VGL27_11375 [Negativicutes bacterium]
MSLNKTRESIGIEGEMPMLAGNGGPLKLRKGEAGGQQPGRTAAAGCCYDFLGNMSGYDAYFPPAWPVVLWRLSGRPRFAEPPACVSGWFGRRPSASCRCQRCPGRKQGSPTGELSQRK